MTLTVNLTEANINHTHEAAIVDGNANCKITIKAFSGNGDEVSPDAAIPAVINRKNGRVTEINSGYTKNNGNIDMKPMGITVSLDNIKVDVEKMGVANLPKENLQPYIVLNYIIATQGLWPSES